MARPIAARWTRRLGAAVAVAGIALGVAVSAGATQAQAATVASVPCGNRTTSQKFKAIDLDLRYYFTAPSGTFENGTSGWVLSNAGVTSGNEPWNVNGGGASSLRIGSGGYAASPIFCNQFGENSLRFFYKGTPGARVHLKMLVTNTNTNNVSTLDWEVVVPLSGWGIAVGVMVPNLYSEGYENLQLTFSALGGTVQVDDVEIDPFNPL